MALALVAVLVRQRLDHAVDLRAAERAARAVAVLVRTTLHSVLADPVH